MIIQTKKIVKWKKTKYNAEFQVELTVPNIQEILEDMKEIRDQFLTNLQKKSSYNYNSIECLLDPKHCSHQLLKSQTIIEKSKSKSFFWLYSKCYKWCVNSKTQNKFFWF